MYLQDEHNVYRLQVASESNVAAQSRVSQDTLPSLMSIIDSDDSISFEDDTTSEFNAASRIYLDPVQISTDVLAVTDGDDTISIKHNPAPEVNVAPHSYVGPVLTSAATAGASTAPDNDNTISFKDDTTPKSNVALAQSHIGPVLNSADTLATTDSDDTTVSIGVGPASESNAATQNHFNQEALPTAAVDPLVAANDNNLVVFERAPAGITIQSVPVSHPTKTYIVVKGKKVGLFKTWYVFIHTTVRHCSVNFGFDY